MLIYNLFIFTVAFLLYMDYLFHKYDTHLVYGGNRISLGNTFMYLALGVIIFFAGFRFEIGYDYTKYLAGWLYDSQLVKWEPLFNFFVRLSRHIDFGLDIQFMFLFYSGITIIILYKALRSLTPHYQLGILFYLLIPSMYLNTFSILRQGIALVILLYGLQYLTLKVDYKKYALVAFIAFLFHYSSIFVAIIYLVGSSFFQKLHSWVLYGFFILISLFLSFAHIGKTILTLMPGHFSVYAEHVIPVSPLKLIVVNVFFIFFLLQKNHFIKSKLEHYLFNSVFVGLLIFNIFSDFVYVLRLAQYFLVAEIVLVPIYLYAIKDTFIRKIMLVLFMVYYLFSFDYALHRDEQFLHGESNALVPYKNYFFEERKSDRNLNIEAWYDYISESTEREEESMK